LMGFYYDQGRDALVIWELWHKKDIFLIGPVTGLPGIFLGPFYYYLIAPFYLLSRGDPLLSGMFLAFLSTLAIFMLYYLGWKFHSRASGIIASAIGAFSYYIVLTGRWLSNPNPIQLTSLLLLFSMYKVATHHDRRWWIAIFFIAGVSMHFEAASAIFYLPMILVFAIWRRNHLPGIKIVLVSIAMFFLTFLPQVIFNFVHDNILSDNFKQVFLEEKSFRYDFWTVLPLRLRFFWDVFHSKLFPGWLGFSAVFSTLSAMVLVAKRSELARSKALILLAIFIGIPMLGFIGFQGNHGNIYDYYMTGYYLPMILLFSLGLGIIWEDGAGKMSVLIFFLFFFALNGVLIKNNLRAGVDGPTHITLGNQLQSVDWVFKDSAPRGEFNVDVYVPPVIPYTYDYLFLWQGTKRCGDSLCNLVADRRVSLLYTLYEVDPPHPERLEAWLKRQEGIGKVFDETRFGGIVVQRRMRYL